MRRLPLLVVLLGALVAPAPAAAADPPPSCGVKRLFGKPLELRVAGKAIPCSRVRSIVRGDCSQRFKRTGWACFSLRTPDPLLIWFRERERFAEEWSTVIEAHRYPCHQAGVTPEGWARARASRRSIFPTRLQVYADDVMRCGVLTGKRYDDVIALLGKPGSDDDYRGERQLTWEIGPERDSFFQVDSDFLFVALGRDGIVKRVEQFQG